MNGECEACPSDTYFHYNEDGYMCVPCEDKIDDVCRKHENIRKLHVNLSEGSLPNCK